MEMNRDVQVADDALDAVLRGVELVRVVGLQQVAEQPPHDRAQPINKSLRAQNAQARSRILGRRLDRKARQPARPEA